MSYEQQFYLKKNEAEVHHDFYTGDKLFWTCGQRDLERTFRRFGTDIDNDTIEFSPLQVMKMLAAMNEDLCKIASAYAVFDEEFYLIQDNELDHSAERMMLETYAVAKMTFKKFADERLETTFYKNMCDENPMDLLVRYVEGIGNIVKDMDESDVLVMKIA